MGCVQRGKLKKGSIENVASRLRIQPRTVRHVWYKHRQSILDPVEHPLNTNRKKGGRPMRISYEDLQTSLKQIPFSRRTTYRSCAAALAIPLTTLYKAMKRGVFQVAGSAIKPHLTDRNKTERLSYCLSFVNADGSFSDMLDRVDINEKRFYITRVKQQYIICPDEIVPHCTARHKNHIIKVMCLTAMARPRQDPLTGVWWDRKIGTWFFTEQVPAQRSSKNRPAGTPETKTVNVNREVTVRTYIDLLFPAIEVSWPAWDTERRVQIQQDNAPPHPPPGKDDPINMALADMATRGWDVALVQQPPNSPDCNTLDLAFFRAIQSLQHTTPSANIDELIANVLLAYKNLPLEVCQKVWTTAQMVMNEIILCKGDNKYKLPHAGKDKIVSQLKRALPYCLPCVATVSQGKLDGSAILSFLTSQGELLHTLVIVRCRHLSSYAVVACHCTLSLFVIVRRRCSS
jgi:hypothetical protein